MDMNMHSFELLNGIESLFDHMPECFFFVKDREGRFLKVNDGMARVFGAADRSDCVGRTDADFLPADIAKSYRHDDLVLLKSGQPMLNRVELVTSPEGIVDWIITTKVPIRDSSGKIVGVAGFARPYEGELTASTMPEELRAAIAHIRKHFRLKLLVPDLADLTHRSVSAFERSFKKHLHMSPTEFLRRVRIHEACQRLINSQTSLAKIANDCGFSDQAHFNRDFKRVMLTTPVLYRSKNR
jgi:PAS domain S-box-containing protein